MILDLGESAMRGWIGPAPGIGRLFLIAGWWRLPKVLASRPKTGTLKR